MNARRYGASVIGLGSVGLLLLGCGSSSDKSGTGSGVSGGSSGTGGSASSGCSSALSDRVRITEVDVGASYAYNEVDNNGAALGLTPLALSPIPGGGSRLAFLEKGASTIHIVTLDANDQMTGSPVTLPGYDFQDIYADANGGTLLISRNAMGSTDNNNCGNINNLCGLVANYPTAASCSTCTWSASTARPRLGPPS